MIDPVSSSYSPYAAVSAMDSSSEASPKKSGSDGSSGPSVIVDISEETLKRTRADMAIGQVLREAQQEQAESAEASPWELPSNMTHAERTLKNGHTEIIDIDGGTLTVREYDGDRLVKSVDGTMEDGRAVLDTSFYDKDGTLTQTIHAEMTQMENKKGWTGAAMTRSVQWYEDGRIVRTLGDEMLLRTRNFGQTTVGGNEWGKMTGRMESDSDSLVRQVTTEKHNVSYHADIKEFYEDGQLSRSMSLNQTGQYEQKSNRLPYAVDDMPEMSTSEVFHDTGLEVRVWEYDPDGELVREATVTDNQVDGQGGTDGKQTQTADISWYKGGEKVKHGSGSFVLEETETAGLMHRPGILDLLGLDTEDYLTPEQQSAPELLGGKLLDSSSQPGFFMAGLDEGVAKGQYGSAGDMSEYGHRDQPFAVDWTTELYEEGELVMRKSDSQRAENAPYRGVDDRLPFRNGGGLSEGDRPLVLESSSHETEIVDDGKVVARESLTAREILNPNEDGPDTLMTLAHYDRLNDDGDDGVNVFYQGELGLADPDSGAALRNMGAEVDLTMESVHDMYRNLRKNAVTGNQDSILHYQPLD